MIIESVDVKNYRSLSSETLQCDNLTVLVGANGSGKSSLLRAIELFYHQQPNIRSEDFYDSTREMSVSITFKDLNTEARNLFSPYLQGDKLTVERVFTPTEKKIDTKYYGSTLQSGKFDSFRVSLSNKDRYATAKVEYEKLRQQSEFSSFPKWSSREQIERVLEEWELEHTAHCVRKRDDGQFFGFNQVGQGYLGRFTQFLFIPAIRDAAGDSCEGRNSVLTQLIDLVVRSTLADSETLEKFRSEIQTRYQAIMSSPETHDRLNKLASGMSTTLATFVPDTSVKLDWAQTQEIDLPAPNVEIKLVEDDYPFSVDRTGHGLQRAFIMTLLQHLANAQTTMTSPNPTNSEESRLPRLPNLVLAIEEPELYQHPNRQRSLSKTLAKLANGATPGVAEKTQIIYCTHSPLFVGLDRLNNIRLLRKQRHIVGKPKITKIISTSLDKIASELQSISGVQSPQFSGQTLVPRLQAIMTTWLSEGFFSDVVVLVEGEEDRAALLGTAMKLGFELEEHGFSVIPCGGKTNIDRPYLIFNQLSIPTYVIWDGDFTTNSEQARKNTQDNRKLLRMLKKVEKDWPDEINSSYACFKDELETTLCCDLGAPLYNRCLQECQKELGFPNKSDAIKNPSVMAGVLKKAEEKGGRAKTLEDIIGKIRALKN